MVKQTLPGQFYGLMFLAGFMLALTGRAWHVMLLFVSESTHYRDDAQWRRYFFAFVGLVPSLAVIIALFAWYGLNGITTGFSEAYDVAAIYGVLMWITFGIHVVTIPAMLGFMMWFYVHPLKRLQRIT